jgi:hypothetical protein
MSGLAIFPHGPGFCDGLSQMIMVLTVIGRSP